MKIKQKNIKKEVTLYSVADASMISGYCEETIRRNCRNGNLKHVKMYHPYTIYITDYTLKEWMDNKDPDKIGAIKNTKALIEFKKREGM